MSIFRCAASSIVSVRAGAQNTMCSRSDLRSHLQPHLPAPATSHPTGPQGAPSHSPLGVASSRNKINAPCSIQPRGFWVSEFVATISSETCVTARDATMATCIIVCSVNGLLHKERQQE
ncbi:uncharacterized protein LOC119293609 [Triticum dicoccoides]|uniref:uncharacterized protein LOC119293609 n=1 Tax=Triticum dicoccoides TaxID=85692 RepID=UPI00188F4719|nr:uncharacterized protein LOC119293609 [Triticum dicoccoides]